MNAEILNQFKQKILSAKFDEGTISESGGTVEIKTPYAVGKINFYLAFEICAGISIVDPELICIRSPMTPDLDKIKDKVKEYIPAEFLPAFVYLRDDELAEYVLLGQMILSLESLKKD